MTARVRYLRYEHRRPVDLADGAATVRAALSRHLTAPPTDRVTFCEPLGIRYTLEPPWFLLVAFGATLGLGLLGHLMASRVPHAGFAAHALAVILDVVAVSALLWLRSSLGWRAEFVADEADLVVTEYVRDRVSSCMRIPAEDITATLVVGPPGRRTVVIAGARNEELACVFREHWMDPPGVVKWMADALALIAAGAGLVKRAPE